MKLFEIYDYDSIDIWMIFKEFNYGKSFVSLILSQCLKNV